jgi:hypothetical protein
MYSMPLKSSFCYSVALATVATATLALPFKAEALTFNFEFDNTPDATVLPPIVGTGTFSFDGDPGNGDFGLTSLANFDFSFTFGGNTFTNADITTPLANILVRISTSGSDRFVNFGGTRGGSFGGSIDFVNASTLSFEPDFGSLYFQVSFFGTYQGIAAASTPTVPEPATVLGLLSVAGVGLLCKRRKLEK